MQEYLYMITEGEKRREQREKRGRGDVKRHTLELGSRETEHAKQRCQPVRHKRDRGATAFLSASARTKICD